PAARRPPRPPASPPRGRVRPRPPAVLEPLSDGRYRLLWLTSLCANTARWMDVVVLGWMALALTDSPLMDGLAAFCRTAPMMALGPFAGVLADRLPRVRVMLAVQVVNVTAATLLAALF